MRLGVCYYPEHWPQKHWAADAKAMSAMGLTYVRIGEFAWSRLEPDPGRFTFEWLDQAIETLGAAGLKVVLGTPTATPPKWLIDTHPDVLAVDRRGRHRTFGSRRHYCFSSETYQRETARIVTALAQRYGQNPHVAAWQTDNEYGCHDTIVSYSQAARAAFRRWLEHKYRHVAALNEAWGAVFWSQEYRGFDEVDPPVETVTEANPAHRLDYQRFASDEVVSYNRLQADILRKSSPGKPILHNFMGSFTAFDHFAVAKDLDAASWDSYPLGFLEQGPWDGPTKLRYMRQGHPDFTAFHHDLYRCVGRGRWWVMEQQPGPVNWAPFNPAPLPGMVRAWTWEAFAHGAEVVSYFRWRQAPFAQEQMHAGLQTPDYQEAPAADEARQVAQELKALGSPHTTKAPVALVYDYEAQWLLDIQPQGKDFAYAELVAAFYGAARNAGLDVDVISPDDPLSGYAIVLAPSLPILSQAWVDKARESGAAIVLGPRTGSKTPHFSIPEPMPIGAAQGLIPLRVARVESLRPGHEELAGAFTVRRWLEHVETPIPPRAATDAGQGVWFARDRVHYLAAWPCAALLRAVLEDAAAASGLALLNLPQDLRLRRRGDVRFAFNYGPEPINLDAHVLGAKTYLIGGPALPPAGVAAWKDSA
jgi:beta-galactosidase